MKLIWGAAWELRYRMKMWLDCLICVSHYKGGARTCTETQIVTHNYIYIDLSFAKLLQFMDGTWSKAIDLLFKLDLRLLCQSHFNCIRFRGKSCQISELKILQSVFFPLVCKIHSWILHYITVQPPLSSQRTVRWSAGGRVTTSIFYRLLTPSMQKNLLIYD